jgi:hypothetical protein
MNQRTIILAFATFLLMTGLQKSFAATIFVNYQNYNPVKSTDQNELASTSLVWFGSWKANTNVAEVLSSYLSGNSTEAALLSNFTLGKSTTYAAFGDGTEPALFSFSDMGLVGEKIDMVFWKGPTLAAATEVAALRWNNSSYPDGGSLDTEVSIANALPSYDPNNSATALYGSTADSGTDGVGIITTTIALGITSGNPPVAVKDELYTYTITANNGATSYSASDLPNGLVVNTATGVISGTPTSVGTFTVTLKANNPLLVEVTKVVTFTVNAPVGNPPVMTPIGAQTAYRGVPFSLAVSASNDPTGFTLSGAPVGFSISTSGLITGTTRAETGTYALSIQASGAGGTSDPQLVTLTLASPTITPSQTTVNGTKGSAITPITFTVVPTSSSPSFDFGDEPTGLIINPTTGTISGTPTETWPTKDDLLDGNPTPTLVTATFSSGVTAQTSIDFNIGSPLPVLLAPAPAELEATRGQEFSLTLQRALNDAVGPFTYEQVSGVDLSTIGLNLQQEATQNTAAGVIYGTPNAIGVYSASFRAYSSSGTSNILPITITVEPAQPVINCELNRTAGVGLPFRHVFTSNDPLHDKVALRLPPGLTFERNVSFNKSFFDMIYGVPTTPGSFPVTLIASTQKFSGSTISTSTTLNIKVEGSRPNVSALGIRSGTFRLNEPTYTTYAPAEGFFLTGSDMGANSTIYMNATGLPPGLGFGKKRDGTDGSTTEKTVARRRGLITGTPTKAGRYPITLYVQNGFGNTKTSIVFTVLP